ncbi:MAG: HAMP domain-containing histidine kinase [Coriobacteriia bacterium]|nr:HAMP domain-containing histidine kinase [Coriobacteriia bacterium]
MRRYVLALVALFVLCAAGILLAFELNKEVALDAAALNDLVLSIRSSDDQQEAFVAASEQLTGLVDDINTQRVTRDTVLRVLLLVVLLVFTAGCALLLLSIHRQILAPFRRLDGFARNVAAGELDTPLEMDRANAFGAFTESFDLMREELRRARENEHLAEQSKRELVASLSHDIQTPVASIKAVAELMEVTADEEQRQRLQTIQQKTEQIHTLVTDLFHATLEELDSLSVNPISMGSDQLVAMVRRADYRGKAAIAAIPGCLLQADPVRLAQVMDNIIANSYKYADTAIEVSTEMLEEGLAVTLRDLGPGADPDELPLLFSKYYRGKAAQGINGYGLGLFISRDLVERMGGHLECANADPGFAVTVFLRFDE